MSGLVFCKCGSEELTHLTAGTSHSNFPRQIHLFCEGLRGEGTAGAAAIRSCTAPRTRLSQACASLPCPPLRCFLRRVAASTVYSPRPRSCWVHGPLLQAPAGQPGPRCGDRAGSRGARERPFQRWRVWD